MLILLVLVLIAGFAGLWLWMKNEFKAMSLDALEKNGILYFFAEILPLFSWSYVALALVLSFIRLIADKKKQRRL
jgi:hypothetical protein